MDSKDLERIDQTIQSMPDTHAMLVEHIRETLAEYIRFGTPAEMQYTKDELDVLLEILNIHDGITGDQVAFVRVYGTIDGDTVYHDDVAYAGTRTIDQILNTSPDLRHFESENPNDFTSSVGVLIDESTLLVVSLNQEEIPLLCSKCPNSDYSCEHYDGKYEYDISYWALLLHPDNLHTIDFYRGQIDTK